MAPHPASDAAGALSVVRLDAVDATSTVRGIPYCKTPECRKM